jgi:hypothetical protein
MRLKKQMSMPNPEFKWLNRLGIGRVILMLPPS